MRNIYYGWALLFFLVYSCSQVDKQSEYDLLVIPIEHAANEILNMSEIADSVKVIKLSNDIILRNIHKLLLDKDENIYILDSEGDGIFKFDKNGKFERQISHKGQGPGEYIRISDFDVLDNHIVISNDGEVLLHFDLQGNFIKNNSKSYFENYGFGKCFCMMGDTIYMSWGSQSLSASWQKGEKGKTFIESRYPKNMLMYSHSFHLTKNKNRVYYEDAFNDTIFEVSGLKYKPAMVIDFGKNKLPAKIHRDNDILNNSSVFNYCCDVSDFKTSDKYLSFNFQRNRKLFACIYNYETSVVRCFSSINNDINYFPVFFIPSYVKDKAIYFYVSGGDVYYVYNSLRESKKASDNDSAKKILELAGGEIDEMDNHYLVIATCK